STSTQSAVSNKIEEEDFYETTIRQTGCSRENEELQLCFADKRDWRLCREELEKFRECWKKHKNDVRVEQKSVA
ncbi:10703_t:CDS:1, partial [Paraglomus occultum]